LSGLVLAKEVLEAVIGRDVAEVGAELPTDRAHRIGKPVCGRWHADIAWGRCIEESEVLTKAHVVAESLVEMRCVLHWWRVECHVRLSHWRQVAALHASKRIVATIVEADCWGRLLHWHVGEVIRHATEQRLLEVEGLRRQSIIESGADVLLSWREVRSRRECHDRSRCGDRLATHARVEVEEIFGRRRTRSVSSEVEVVVSSNIRHRWRRHEVALR